MIYNLFIMHTITPAIRNQINRYSIDSGTKAGILRIFEECGVLKSSQDLRNLDEKEQGWFHRGFEHYIEDHEHPIRSLHTPHHWGKWIYSLSLFYYLSIVVWITLLINASIQEHASVAWSKVWPWVGLASLFNVALTFYGINLELKAYRGQFVYAHKIIATVAIIVLIIAIAGNIISPLVGNADIISPFMISR